MNCDWIGEAEIGTTLKSSRHVTLYDAVRIRRTKSCRSFLASKALLVAKGDFVHLRSPNNGEPFIARIRQLWEEPKTGLKMLTVQWCYRLEDLPKSCQNEQAEALPNEIYFTEHFDLNEVGCILSTIRVAFTFKRGGNSISRLTGLFADGVCPIYGRGNEFLSDSGNSTSDTRGYQADYMCTKRFDHLKGRLVPLTEDYISKLHAQRYIRDCKQHASVPSAEDLRTRAALVQPSQLAAEAGNSANQRFSIFESDPGSVDEDSNSIHNDISPIAWTPTEKPNHPKDDAPDIVKRSKLSIREHKDAVIVNDNKDYVNRLATPESGAVIEVTSVPEETKTPVSSTICGIQ